MEVRYPPLERGISAILARYHMKTRQMGARPPSAILFRKGIARYGGVSRTGPLSLEKSFFSGDLEETESFKFYKINSQRIIFVIFSCQKVNAKNLESVFLAEPPCCSRVLVPNLNPFGKSILPNPPNFRT